MSSITDLGHFIGKGFDGVTGDIPRRFDVVCFPEVEKTFDSAGSAKDTF